MIRSNLKAGGSIQQAGSEITATKSGNTLTIDNIPSDAEAISVYVVDADTYGSVLQYIALLSDVSNPITFAHTGSVGTLSSATYSNGTLVLTLSTSPGGVFKATALKVA